MIRLFYILIFLIISFSLKAVDNDTIKKDLNFYGGFGYSFGLDSKTGVVFQNSFNWIYGYEFNLTRDYKMAMELDAFKFTWIRLTNDKNLFGDDYSKIRYFSFSNSLKWTNRFIINRDEIFKGYTTYIDLGAGYNVPILYRLSKVKSSSVDREEYVNKYNDLFLYFKLFQFCGFPLALRLEYHPFDIIKNDIYPDVQKIDLGLEFILHDW